jgi:hypothetical protein
MIALALHIVPTRYGCAVRCSDGRVLVRYWGPSAQQRALRFARRYAR